MNLAFHLLTLLLTEMELRYGQRPKVMKLSPKLYDEYVELFKCADKPRFANINVVPNPDSSGISFT